MGDGGGGKKWIAWGCAGVAALALIVVGTILGLAAWAVRTEKLAEPALARDLPAASANVAVLPVSDPGKVILSLDAGELYVEAAEPGEQLGVEASYDPRYYELVETMHDGLPWTYRVTLRTVGPTLIAEIKSVIGGSKPRVRVRLPRDVPIDLEVAATNSVSDVDIGGLSVTSAEFRIEGGSLLDLIATEPLPAPVERIELRGSRGALFVRSLAAASPREIDLDFRMGAIQLDMRGDWAADSRIAIGTAVSDLVLRLPRHARVEGLETGRPPPPAAPELEPPTLTFTLATGVRGSVKVLD